jgi:bifunctional non-homologous end joining protein LigD
VDGELVAFGDDGLPSFPRLCDRMLHGKKRIDVMLVVFDVLSIDGRPVHRRPHCERRQVFEELELDGDYWSTGRGWIKTKNRDYWRYPAGARRCHEGGC